MHSIASEIFTLDYNSFQRVLVARWLQPTELADIKASYEAVLAAAQANDNCRHWLLDVRRRSVGDAAGLEWFRQEFSGRLMPTLGGPVFIAYFAMIDQAAALQVAGVSDSIAEGEAKGGHYYYFNREDEALAWLAKQP
jgi:hypothetical protein